MPLRATQETFGIPAHLVERTWHAPRPLSEALAADTAPHAEAVEVYANHGRWVVDCPDCNNAQLAHRDIHRFMCNNCGDGAVDGLWRPTIWPDNAAEIDTELMRRRHERNRNWYPGETVADLQAEHAGHESGRRR